MAITARARTTAAFPIDKLEQGVEDSNDPNDDEGAKCQCQPARTLGLRQDGNLPRLAVVKVDGQQADLIAR
jgi:hypothetical protein